MSAEATPGEASKTSWLDLAMIAVCALIWGTTWYAITLQFGVVDPIVSLIYRFALASALLFCWSMARGEAVQLTRPQHAAAFGLGLFNFAVDYAFVYWAEERVTSAVVAVMFAALAFINLISFRIAFGQRAPMLSWCGAGLGILGVAALSWEEIASAEMGAAAWLGIGMTLAGVVGASIGNIYARRGELAGAPVGALTGWAMFYGAAVLAMFAFATGRAFTFEPTWTYVLSLVHLALNGSVVAFVLYYGLARRRGYATASYIAALTPPLAMLISSVFEGKNWGAGALAGIVLVLAGQVLLLRVRRS